MHSLPEKLDSKFRFVLLASARAEQMMQGAHSKVESRHAKPSRIAMQEILAEAVDWDYGPLPSPEDEAAAEGAENEAEAVTA